MKKIPESSDKNEIDCGGYISKGCTSCSTSKSNSIKQARPLYIDDNDFRVDLDNVV